MSAPSTDADLSAPSSLAIIRAVVASRAGPTALLDRSALHQLGAAQERLCTTLGRLHQIGMENTPVKLRRLVRESEVERAATLLRRLVLITPDLDQGTLVAHCEQTATEDLDYHAHLLDPFQLRHVLTFHEDIPHENLTAVELYELSRALEQGQTAAVSRWFRQIGARAATLPRGTTAHLRELLGRHCHAGMKRETLAAYAFELAALDVQLVGPLGWENSRLFCALLKQIGGDTVPGLESYVEPAEIGQAVLRFRATGNKRQLDYFFGLESVFDHTALQLLERNVLKTAEQRSAEAYAATPAARPAPVPQPAAPVSIRRGLLAGLFTWAHS